MGRRGPGHVIPLFYKMDQGKSDYVCPNESKKPWIQLFDPLQHFGPIVHYIIISDLTT